MERDRLAARRARRGEGQHRILIEGDRQFRRPARVQIVGEAPGAGTEDEQAPGAVVRRHHGVEGGQRRFVLFPTPAPVAMQVRVVAHEPLGGERRGAEGLIHLVARGGFTGEQGGTQAPDLVVIGALREAPALQALPRERGRGIAVEQRFDLSGRALQAAKFRVGARAPAPERLLRIRPEGRYAVEHRIARAAGRARPLAGVVAQFVVATFRAREDVRAEGARRRGDALGVVGLPGAHGHDQRVPSTMGSKAVRLSRSATLPRP